MPDSPAVVPERRVAVVAGATGLVGRHLVRRLVADPLYREVASLQRRDTPPLGPTHRVLVVDFERLADVGVDLAGADVFCALGTTLREAGSREAFRRVDFTYVVRLAALAGNARARAFYLVSSLGADAGSRVFYSRVKGEAESAVAASGIPIVRIARPSLLTGDRPKARFGESVAASLLRPAARLLVGPLANVRPIEADTVAAALVALAHQDGPPGVTTYDPQALRRVAQGAKSLAGS